MNSVETNNQVEYTQEEKDLAAKYKVEPKLIRMIAEIVCEHTAGICELISLYSGKKKQGSEPEQAETQDQPQEKENQPNTGIPPLDKFLERLSYEAQATAYGALRLVCVSDATGKKMRDYLQKQVALLENPRQVDDLMMDGQVLADIKWFLGFVKGAEIGLDEC